MAKLNGVKTVSERIQYNGAEYVKSDEAAVVGDIVRFDDSSSYLTTGAFYEVTRIDSLDDPQVIDDDGDEYDLCGEDITVFKRVEVVATEPVDSEYKQKAVVGDKIRVVNAWGTLGKYENGDEFVAKSVRNDGAVFVSEHDRPIALNEYEIITIPQYREVKRKANVGERIRIVNAWLSLAQYKNGDEFIVKQTGGGGSGVQVDGAEIAICTSEYVVLEAAKVEETAHEPQVGDKVRSHKYPETLYTLVKRLPQNDGRYGKAWDITPGSWLGENQFYIVERATDTEKPAEESRLKVGEYAKVLAGGMRHPLEVGDIVKIIRDEADHQPFYTSRLSDNKRSYFEVTQLILATDAEVAEAKRVVEEAAAKAAETAKWAKIGRKVGEIREGDIVRVLSNYPKSSQLCKDDVGEVSGYDGVRFRVNTSTKILGNYVHAEDVELIAPVESLFSKEA